MKYFPVLALFLPILGQTFHCSPSFGFLEVGRSVNNPRSFSRFCLNPLMLSLSYLPFLSFFSFLSSLSYLQTRGHNWHIHQTKVDHKTEKGWCLSAKGHYNPFKINITNVSPCTYICHSWELGCVKSVDIRSFSRSYFPAFGQNSKIYRVTSKRGKIRTRKTSNTDTFWVVLEIC